MSYFEKLSLILGTISISILVSQLYLLYKSYKADHERRRKQATIEYVNNIRKSYRPLSDKLREKFKERVINTEEVSEEDQQDIKEFLSIVEHLSVGINTGVYDLNILSRMSGRYFRNMYEKLLPYINFARQDSGSNTTYCEFEEVYTRLKEIVSAKPTRGNIKNT